MDEDQASTVLAAGSDRELMSAIEAIEEAWDEENLAECDKAWDAMHRCFTDGELTDEGGEAPLNRFVLGEASLDQHGGYIVCYKDPELVCRIAEAAEPLTEEWFRSRYFQIVPKSYALEYGEVDCGYTWEWFCEVRDLYMKAAAQGKAVLFTVDQ